LGTDLELGKQIFQVKSERGKGGNYCIKGQGKSGTDPLKRKTVDVKGKGERETR